MLVWARTNRRLLIVFARSASILAPKQGRGACRFPSFLTPTLIPRCRLSSPSSYLLFRLLQLLVLLYRSSSFCPFSSPQSHSLTKFWLFFFFSPTMPMSFLFFVPLLSFVVLCSFYFRCPLLSKLTPIGSGRSSSGCFESRSQRPLGREKGKKRTSAGRGGIA